MSGNKALQKDGVPRDPIIKGDQSSKGYKHTRYISIWVVRVSKGSKHSKDICIQLIRVSKGSKHTRGAHIQGVQAYKGSKHTRSSSVQRVQAYSTRDSSKQRVKAYKGLVQWEVKQRGSKQMIANSSLTVGVSFLTKLLLVKVAWQIAFVLLY